MHARASIKLIQKVLLLFSLLGSESLWSQQPAVFINDICLPRTLYMMEGVQNDLFVEPLIKRWRPYNDVVRFSGTSAYSRRLQRMASISNPTDGGIVTLDLINQDEFKTLKTLSASIRVGQKRAGTDTVTFSIIGDSFTHGAFFKDALLEKGYIPKIRMIGLREVNGHSGQFDEGRGGWTLKNYFTVSNQRTQAYNGFFQPAGNYRYWGATAFWQLVKQLKTQPDKSWAFNERYNADRFASMATGFNESSGLRSKPQKNDLMYDNKAEQYILFDGKQWNKVKYEDFQWDFDYGKYLSMWDLRQPMILAEFLGLNDFRNAKNPAEINFTEWNTQMEKLIKSYKKAVPGGKFALMIPSSTCGILDNQAGDFTTKQNACMWELRRNIIENFDERSGEQIYVVDAAIAIDNLEGSRFSTDSTFTLPYSGYTGNHPIAVQTGNPHPYPNYPTMGISLAAFIQIHRSK